MVGLYAGLISIGGKSQNHEATHSYQAGAQIAYQPEQSDTDRAGIPSLAERFVSNPEPADSNDREKRELAAQESMSVWAFWVLLLSFCQLIVSAFGLWALLRTIDQGREALRRADDANEISRNAMVAENRAWIKIVPKFGELFVSDHWISMEVEAIVYNTGHSVARNVVLWASLHLKPDHEMHDIEFDDIPDPQFFVSDQHINIWQGGDHPFMRDANGLGVSQANIPTRKYKIFLRIVAQYRTIFDTRDSEPKMTELICQLARTNGLEFKVSDIPDGNSPRSYDVFGRHDFSGGGKIT